MCVKLSTEDLNPNLYFLNPTSFYTCLMIIALKVCDGNTT